MRSQKGITLLAVTIYVLVIAIVIGVVSTITSFFYSNTKEIEASGMEAAEFEKFNMEFLRDMQNEANPVSEPVPNTTAKTVKQIRFKNGTTYTYLEDGIYRNKVKICSNVKDCSFKVYKEGPNTIVDVLLIIGESFANTITYVKQPSII